MGASMSDRSWRQPCGWAHPANRRGLHAGLGGAAGHQGARPARGRHAARGSKCSKAPPRPLPPLGGGSAGSGDPRPGDQRRTRIDRVLPRASPAPRGPPRVDQWRLSLRAAARSAARGPAAPHTHPAQPGTAGTAPNPRPAQGGRPVRACPAAPAVVGPALNMRLGDHRGPRASPRAPGPPPVTPHILNAFHNHNFPLPTGFQPTKTG